jgi:hypothetical protein
VPPPVAVKVAEVVAQVSCVAEVLIPTTGGVMSWEMFKLDVSEQPAVFVTVTV